jgi:hypothetical protein
MRVDRVGIIPFIELRCDAPACGTCCCVLGHSWKDCESRAAALGWALNLKRRRCLCPLCATLTAGAGSTASAYDTIPTGQHTTAPSRI